MRAGMVVDVIVDPVAPRAAPPVTFEQPLDDGGRIRGAFHVNRAAIVDEGQLGIVRDKPVVVEAGRPCFALANMRGGFLPPNGRPIPVNRSNVRLAVSLAYMISTSLRLQKLVHDAAHHAGKKINGRKRHALGGSRVLHDFSSKPTLRRGTSEPRDGGGEIVRSTALAGGSTLDGSSN